MPARRGGDPKSRPWRRFLRNLPGNLAVLLILLCLGYVITLENTVNIVTLSPRSDSNLLRPKEDYAQTAKRILADSPFSRTKISVDSNGFEKKMLVEFPELDRATLTLPLMGHRPIVDLIARKPVMMLANAQGVWLLDKNGLVMMKAADATGLDSLGLSTVIDESNLEVVLGRGVLTAQSVTFIADLSNQLAAAKVVVQSLTLPASANELRLQVAGRPYYIKFNMENDPRLSAGEFLALQKKLDAEGITPGEYIDLRLGERAFYK